MSIPNVGNTVTVKRTGMSGTVNRILPGNMVEVLLDSWYLAIYHYTELA